MMINISATFSQCPQSVVSGHCSQIGHKRRKWGGERTYPTALFDDNERHAGPAFSWGHMINFEDLFVASRGQPVEYEGEIIQLTDALSLPGAATVRIIREGSKRGWRQGIHLSTDGHFIVNEQTIPKAVVLWADTAPAIVSVGIHSESGTCHVKNVWDTGDGTMQSWHNGAAMIVEHIDSGRLYRCNDGKPNADFDDLVFRLELIAATPR
jgi:hypothetical protein